MKNDSICVTFYSEVVKLFDRSSQTRGQSINCVSEVGIVIGSVRLSVYTSVLPFVFTLSFEPSDL